MGLIIDSFAGGGGASMGILTALERSPDIAINHSPEAIAMHKANHPETKHFIEDIWTVDPVKACGGQPVDLMWASPDCTHFSKAKGSAPKSPRIRGLAWVVTRWAKAVRPRVICLENVEEFVTWGPVDKLGRPVEALKGTTFDIFVNTLRKLGYKVDWRELVACNYGAPTSRKRFFLVARCDGEKIRWPEHTNGMGAGKKYRTAAECIDWTIPTPSIFERKRELKDATKYRIAKGIVRYVLNNKHPFIVEDFAACIVKQNFQVAPCSLDTPLHTVTSQHNKHALVTAFLAKYHGEQSKNDARVKPLTSPIDTLDGSNRYGLCTAIITKQYTSNDVGRKVDAPLPTVTSSDHNALTVCHLTRQFGTSVGSGLDEPVGTVMPGGCGKTGLVAAFLEKYYGSEKMGRALTAPLDTVTGKDRFALVTVNIGGEPYMITDIGMRMLQPRELFNAQGFPADYIIDPIYNGKPLTKTEQVKMCGNSVCPPVAAALVKANCAFMLAKQNAA